MKRFNVLLFLTLFVGSVFAQQSTEINFKSLEKKIAKSDVTIQHEKKALKTNTWIKRGDLMMKAYDAMILNSYTGMDVNEFNLIIGSPIERSEVEKYEMDLVKFKMERTDFYFYDNGLLFWEYTNPLQEKPLDEAYKSLLRAQELDVKGKKAKKLLELYESLKIKYIIEGSVNYAKADYENAFHDFKNASEIGEMPLVSNVDTVMLYYTGLSAQLIGDIGNAVKYYDKAIAYELFMDGNVYFNAYDAYKSQGKASEGIGYLEDGFLKFPQNQNILYSLIDYYIQHGDNPDKIILYIDQAIATDSNPILYFAKATLLENLGQFDLSVESYKKAIEIDSNYFDAVFNLGVIYYNRGVEFLNEASALSASEVEKYDELIAKSNADFKHSVPYMQRAYEIDPSNIISIETLRNLYFRFRMESDEYMKKYEEINEYWNSLK